MKWTSWAATVLGLWLIIAPFALAHTGSGVVNDVVVGAAVAVAGSRVLAARATRVVPLSVFIAAAGVWLAMAPFFFIHVPASAALWNDLLIGSALLLLGAARALNPTRGGA